MASFVCLTVKLLPALKSTFLPLSIVLLVAPLLAVTSKPFIVPRPAPLISRLPAAFLATVMPSLPTTLTLPFVAGTSVPLAWIVHN